MPTETTGGTAGGTAPPSPAPARRPTGRILLRALWVGAICGAIGGGVLWSLLMLLGDVHRVDGWGPALAGTVLYSPLALGAGAEAGGLVGMLSALAVLGSGRLGVRETARLRLVGAGAAATPAVALLVAGGPPALLVALGGYAALAAALTCRWVLQAGGQGPDPTAEHR